MSGRSDEVLTKPVEASVGVESAEANEMPRVAFQGEPGAFSEEAIREYFGPAAIPVPCREFRDVGVALRSGATDLALLPIENTLAGAVVGSYDVLAGGGVEIIGEVILPIRHFLLGVPGSSLEGVRRVLSHPVALAQCTRFLAEHREIEAVAVHDTAGAAREVAERGDPKIAAIAPRGAAERYGLEPIAGDLQDRSDNQTRFLVLVRRDDEEVPGDGKATSSTEPVQRDSGPWKSMLIAEMDNQPGALVALLTPFAERGVNLSALECRPGGEPWTYRFFIELTTDLNAGEARAALEEARERAVRMTTLGVFRPARRD